MDSTIPQKYALHYALWLEKINKKGSPRITRTPLTHCWTHITSPSTGGYGQITIKGQYWQLHRLSWFLHNGCPDERTHSFWDSHQFHVAHLCDNGYCANPEHLKLQSNKENISDGVKLREAKKEKPPKPPKCNIEPCLECVKHHKKCSGGDICERCKEHNLDCIKKEYKTTAGAFSKGSGSGETNIKAILTKDKVLQIRRRYIAGLKYGELKKMAEEYGVSYPTIQAVVGNRIWTEPEFFP